MSKLNGKSLSYAVLHTGIFVPNVGQIPPTLSSKMDGVNKAVKMTIDEPFIIVEIQDKFKNTISMPIPITYFTHMVLEKETQSAPIALAKKA